MSKTDEIIHFLDVEIEQSEKQIKDYNTMFDGIEVDNKTRIALVKSHIRFCEHIKKYIVGMIEWEISDEITQDDILEEPYIEEWTECDSCEQLSDCINNHAVYDITTKYDTVRHFMIGLDGCPKDD
ncbi:MAG TPA: hypothetical protein VN258_06495 [Mobilitalea sp.]|nr:hypothetical protein [Mobilitalea sp.]